MTSGVSGVTMTAPRLNSGVAATNGSSDFGRDSAATTAKTVSVATHAGRRTANRVSPKTAVLAAIIQATSGGWS